MSTYQQFQELRFEVRQYFDSAKPKRGGVPCKPPWQGTKPGCTRKKKFGKGQPSGDIPGFVEKLPHLPEDTFKEHFDGKGRVKDYRAPLHAKIMSEFLDAVPPTPKGQQPHAILMMGAPASGKSSATRGIDKSKYVQVDPDAIKERLPEYREAVKGKATNAASMAHEESSHLAKQIRASAIAENKPVLIDGTGKNLANYEKLINDLKAKGYKVELRMPTIPVEEGIKRATARAQNTGRVVPEVFIRDAYNVIPKNFMKLKELVDEAHLYDNSGREPREVYSKAGGKEVRHDKAFMKSFGR